MEERWGKDVNKKKIKLGKRWGKDGGKMDVRRG